MAQILKFIAGFFSSKPDSPSMKRLCGLLCTLFLCYTMYINSKTDEHKQPSVTLVQSVALLAFGCLGLTSAEVIMKKKKEETKSDE